MKINSAMHSHSNINFKSYNMIDNNTGNSISTNFYHDSEVLQKAVKIIEKEFPKGTNILVYAGSNGEEALSLNTLLNNRQKYKIYSIDKSSKAIDFAHKGIYAIHPLADDGFLINLNTEENKQFLCRIFHKNFLETKPSFPINNLSDPIYTIRFDIHSHQISGIRIQSVQIRRSSFCTLLLSVTDQITGITHFGYKLRNRRNAQFQFFGYIGNRRAARFDQALHQVFFKRSVLSATVLKWKSRSHLLFLFMRSMLTKLILFF